jgi:protein phosphatase
VADGMGGAAGGQIASQTVLGVAREVLEDRFETEVEPEELKGVLQDLFDEAHAAIRRLTEEDPSLEGMGTTLTCVIGCKDRFVVGNLGDSRSYYLSGTSITQISVDHSYLNEFKRKSGNENLDPDFVAKYGHIINKTLDGSGDQPDFFPKDEPYYHLSEQDGFLLCSDGLIADQLDNQQEVFRSYMLGTPDLKTAAESLVSLAYYSGSTDNISVVVAEAGSLSRELGRVRTYPFPPQQQEHA